MNICSLLTVVQAFCSVLAVTVVTLIKTVIFPSFTLSIAVSHYRKNIKDGTNTVICISNSKGNTDDCA